MPVYNYIATDSNGMRRTGFVDARTEELALSLLKNQGLYVVSLSERRDSIMDSFMDLRGVPENEIINFTRQFSTMISAGLPLSRALEVLTDQTNNKKMKKILTDVLRDVEGGSPLSGALSRYPKVFNRTYQALIKAGESSGKLDEILKKLAQTMEDQRELLSNFKSAMIYPTIVFFAMIGVFVMMMVFVIPKLASMYDSMNIELPGMTKFMIQISRLFSDRFPVLLIITVVTTLVVRSFLKSDAGKEFKSFADKLFTEIKEAYAGTGYAMTKKQNIEKQAEQNKAFAHLKW
jgi:type II secretory pathway component PulF